MSTEISSTIVHSRTACSNAAVSNCLMWAWPSFLNAIRLSEARLHAVSSRNMYSEHGLDARIAPPFGQVCQSLMVEWNWMPGSAQDQAAYEICSHSSRAFMRLWTLPSLRRLSSQSPSSATAERNVSLTRTVLFEFWPDTDM